MIPVINNNYDTSYDNMKTGVLYIPNGISDDTDDISYNTDLTEREDDSYE